MATYHGVVGSGEVNSWRPELDSVQLEIKQDLKKKKRKKKPFESTVSSIKRRKDVQMTQVCHAQPFQPLMASRSYFVSINLLQKLSFNCVVIRCNLYYLLCWCCRVAIVKPLYIYIFMKLIFLLIIQICGYCGFEPDLSVKKMR